MKHLIIGTAGHIDHGKTALIKALTGFDGDETKEEKARGITMDLSFAHMESGDNRVAFIDVPGHEKLVKNMIAGAFGFDYVLLVVAADEGIMPQTREHLGVVDMLGVEQAIVVITKTDKADSTQIAAVKEQINQAFETTRSLRLHTLLPVSIYDPESMANLKTCLLALPERQRPSAGFFRYYIDRAFSIKGAGVVVTGTVLDGEVKPKDRLFAYDIRKEVSVRSVQVHGEAAAKAVTGERAALGLSGVEQGDLERGMLLGRKGFLRGFNRIDAYARALPGEMLRHDSRVQFFWGANRCDAQLVFLEGSGEAEEAFVQLVTDKPVFAVFNDPFIIRSDATTIGGGQILGPVGDPMRKTQKKEFLEALHRGDTLTAFGILVQAHAKGFGLVGSNQRFGLAHGAAIEAARRLPGCFVDETELVVYDERSKRLLQKAALSIFDKNRRALLSAVTLSHRFKWSSRAFVESALQELLANKQLILENGLYRHPECDVEDAKSYIETTLMRLIDEAGMVPEAPYNLYDSLDLDRPEGDEALKSLTKQGKVVRLEHNLFVGATNLQRAMEQLRGLIKREGYADVQNVKTTLGFSRKYALAYLEYLDKFDDIKREENRRVLLG